MFARLDAGEARRFPEKKATSGVSEAQRAEVLRKLLRPPQPEDEGSLDVEELTVEWASSSRTYLSIFISELNRRLQAIAEMGFQSGLHPQKEWFERSGRRALLAPTMFSNPWFTQFGWPGLRRKDGRR